MHLRESRLRDAPKFLGSWQMIRVMKADSWVEYRGQPPNRRQGSLTHQATIRDLDGQLRRCYLKMDPPNVGDVVLAEWIGHLLLSALDIPRSAFAGIVLVPIDKLAHSLTIPEQMKEATLWPAFCCELVDNFKPVVLWRWRERLLLSRMYQEDEVIRIAAFDEWVDNPDRHDKNIILSRDGKFVAIDHDHLLQSILSKLAVVPQTIMLQARKCLTPKDFDKFSVSVASASNQHSSCFTTARSDIEEAVKSIHIGNIPSDTLFKDIDAFLTERSQDGWLAQKLQVIA